MRVADPYKGKPYVIKEHLHPANLLGFGRRELVRVVFEWTEDGGERELSRVPHWPRGGSGILFLSNMIWRGFSREAREDRITTLESGLMPGAVAREIVREDE